MAFLLAIEGADGAGKATVSAAVADLLRGGGRRAEVVSFPRYAETAGGHVLGEYLAGRLPRDVSGPLAKAAQRWKMLAIRRAISRSKAARMAS